MSSLKIGVLIPEVLGTYGDSGNAQVLAKRADLRGIDTEIIQISLAERIPDDLDIYTIGGGEDIAQTIASHKLASDDGLRGAIEAGRPALAVCAGMQLMGIYYTDSEGNHIPGAGVVNIVTQPQGMRAIGELACEPGPKLVADGISEILSGFENHGGATAIAQDDASLTPFGFVIAGVGNGVPGKTPIPMVNHLESASESGGGAGVESAEESAPLRSVPIGYTTEYQGRAFDGVVYKNLYCTYMHGPVLARNPKFADLLLAKALGVPVAELSPIEIPGLSQLRRERRQAVERS